MLEDKKSHTQLNYLQEYEFAKTRVMAGKVHTGEMIALRPVAENLGLNWSGVHQALKRDDKLSQLCSTVCAIAEDGKSREMACLPPDAFQTWLWSLDPSKYKNFNLQIWEEYKKGLVLHLLMMLRTALDHMQQTSEENFYNAELKQMMLSLISLEKEGYAAKSNLNTLKKQIKDLKVNMEMQALLDPNQMQIDFTENN